LLTSTPFSFQPNGRSEDTHEAGETESRLEQGEQNITACDRYQEPDLILYSWCTECWSGQCVHLGKVGMFNVRLIYCFWSFQR